MVGRFEKKFDVDVPESASSAEDMKEINLGELEEQSPFQRVGITVKVLDIADVTSLDTDRQFQTVSIADQSRTAELDLWQEHVGAVTIGKTYLVRNAMVKFYNEQFRLTTPKRMV